MLSCKLKHYFTVHAGKEYIKALLQNGRMVGAILIGETDLEVSSPLPIRISIVTECNMSCIILVVALSQALMVEKEGLYNRIQVTAAIVLIILCIGNI